MNSETSITLTTVSQNTVQFEISQGTVSLTVLRHFPGEMYEVDTPNASFTVMKPGVYRVDVYPNEDQTWATTRRGLLTATGRGNAVNVNAGEQVRFRGGDSMQRTSEKAPATDGFDDWANVRNQRLGAFRSAPFRLVFGCAPWGFGPAGMPGPVAPVWMPYPR